MASLRSRTTPTNRPSEMRPRRGIEDYAALPKDQPSPGLAVRRPKEEPEERRTASRTISQAKAPSRIPHTATQKRPSLPSPADRPSLGRPPQPWGGAPNPSSGRSVPTFKGPPSTTSKPAKVSTPTPSQPRKVLRRKRSGLSENTSGSGARKDSTSGSNSANSSSSIPPSLSSGDLPAGAQYDRGLTESPMEVRVAQRIELPKTTAHAVTIYPELDRYGNANLQSAPDSPNPTSGNVPSRLATNDLPPPTPLFSGTSSQMSGSPSTRFSGSPGPGPYSRDTTPTSLSSQSPGLVVPMRLPASKAARQVSPVAPAQAPPLLPSSSTITGAAATTAATTATTATATATTTTPVAAAQTRPPVTRRRAGSTPNEDDSASAGLQGLAAVRESLTSSSSSSNSTVREAEKKENREKSKSKKKLHSPPPSPPPRKSSQKFRGSWEGEEGGNPSPSPKPSRDRAQPVTTLQPPHPQATSSPHAQLSTSPNATPPVRPSRDGTPDLQSQLGLPHPIVIHSNLSSASLSERRHSSLAPPLPPASSPPSKSMPSASAADHHYYHPHRHRPQSRLVVPGKESPSASRTTSSSARRSLSSPETGRAARTPSPGVSTFRSRFQLFGRRTKTAPEASQPPKKEKPKRKGPAAGTGHEGYGRLGAARRRSSSASNGGRADHPGTISSQESLSSNQTHDSFLADRMAPVVIAGGEVIQNRNTSFELTRTESNQSSAGPTRPPSSSRNGSQSSLSSGGGLRAATLWPSAFPRGQTNTRSAVAGHSRRPSDSSDSESAAMKSTLAFRRSAQKLKSGGQPIPKLPKPLRTGSRGTSPSITSVDASLASEDSAFERSSDRRRGRKESSSAVQRIPTPKKLTKRNRSPRRWNLFGRSQSQPATSSSSSAAATTKRKAESTKTVAATVKAVHSKPVAFYTMMDSSEQEDVDGPDLGDVLREAAARKAPPSSNNYSRSHSRSRSRSRSQSERRQSTSQGSDAWRRPSVIRPQSREQETAASRHAPYLPPPAAHSRHDYSTPPNSRGGYFESNRPNSSQYSSRPTLNSPSSPKLARPVRAAPEPDPVVQHQPPVNTTRLPNGRPSRLPQVGRIPKVVSARPQQTSPKSFSRPFNRVSMSNTPPSYLAAADLDSLAKGPTPPKLSTPELTHDGSTITSHTNNSSMLPGDAPTRTPPVPDLARGGREFLAFSPRKNSQGTVTTSSGSSGMLTFADATAIVPQPGAPLVEDEIWDEYNDLLGEENNKVPPPSAGSSMGKPFHLEVYSSGLRNNIEQRPLQSSSPYPPQSPSGNYHEMLQNDMAPYETPGNYQSTLATQIKEALTLGSDPPTPFSVGEFVTGYGDRNNSVGSSSCTAVVSQRRSNSSSGSRDAKQMRKSDASGSSLSSDSSSPLSQVNLRVGSMSVSKWLTFGHVLFSPARDQLVPYDSNLSARHSVLIIDGLGNDDWSFYAAETYPTTTFYNLSPRAPLPADRRDASAFPLTPQNHHQVQYLSQAGKFPFGSQSFTSVVFRFPVAAPESHYRNIISEARRVLRPGGFIELSILDVDLNNMGNRGRRSVRHLKERIHARAPNTSLGSTADLMVRLLGRKGFFDIKSCRVGVPVASAVTRGSGYGGAGGPGGRSRDGSSASSRSRPKPKKDDRSLAEMMRDDSAVADEGITKMVAKVGRWWYSRCYESVAAVPGSGPRKSLWNDRALLAECEEWGTSLKLMVCHARAPDGNGRMASI